jgi:hypothetical protein
MFDERISHAKARRRNGKAIVQAEIARKDAKGQRTPRRKLWRWCWRGDANWLQMRSVRPSGESGREVQAGAEVMSWFGVACELHRDWRNDIEGLATLFSNHLPAYRNLMTSYNAKK